MHYRIDHCDLCREANHDTIAIQARTIAGLMVRLAAAEAAVAHLLDGREADGALEAVRGAAAVAERARQAGRRIV